MALLDPAVSLTDLGLALENGLFTALLWRTQAADGVLRRGWLVFFGALALAALLGFVSHGFFADKAAPAHQAVWTAILLTIGLIALPAAAIAARLLLPPAGARIATHAAAVLVVLYALIVLIGFRRYAIAIAIYLPAALFLLTAFVVRGWRAPARHWNTGILALTLTFAAAFVQQKRFGLHPEYFNHNALYHLLQAVALWLLYIAARGQLRAQPA